MIVSAIPDLGPDRVMRYELQLLLAGSRWSVRRRYSEFATLRAALREAVPAVNALPFPPRRLHCALCAVGPLGKHDPTTVAARASTLSAWLTTALSLLDGSLRQAVMYTFLEMPQGVECP